MASPAVWMIVLVLAASIYCRIDPWKKGSMVDFPGFQTYAVQQPSSAELVAVGIRDSEDLLQKSELRFNRQVQGPESIIFDSLGRGPYTGVADGRVLFWDGNVWQEFAVTSTNRSDVCEPKSNPMSYLEYEHICGRPLGIRFHKRTGDLYIADAYYGILKVGPEGGLATPITTEAEGVPFKFTNDLDVDDQGNIFFTDSSSVYQRKNFMQLIFTAEPSGRLLKYSPVTKETTVLVDHLQFPNGVSLSKDGSFLVFCELMLGRLSRYWLKGEKAGTRESFAVLPGFPDNVRTNKEGHFWVALHCRRSFVNKIMSIFPRLRKFFLSLPVPAKYHFYVTCGKPHGVIIKYDADGNMMQILEDRAGKVVKLVSEVEERDGQLWIGSVLMPFIAVYRLNP
ncbi:putative Strictosidine synthase [Zostera marina]|uniref:Putative Strictosidine synthase n=1 Tax=Zostera marina TaxID=29655 RepID=A0A0K9NKL9_ZOSMR|nr:putative Strictosidine synthase [Zostera marina]